MTSIIKFLCLAIPLCPRGELGGAVAWLMNAASHKKTRLRHLKLTWPFTLCVYSNCSLLSAKNSVSAWGRVSFFFTPSKLTLTVSAWWRSVLWYAWSTPHPSVTPSTHSVFSLWSNFKNKRDKGSYLSSYSTSYSTKVVVLTANGFLHTWCVYIWHVGPSQTSQAIRSTSNPQHL